MNTRYVYNPYSDTYIVSSVHYLTMLKPYFETLAQILEHIAELPRYYTGDKLFTYFETADDYGALIIRDMRLAPRSYYEYWMLHHMLRVAFLASLSIDIAKLRLYQEQNIYEPDSIEVLKLRVMLEQTPMQKLNLPE